MKRTRLWKTILSGALALGMTLSLLPAGSMEAKAEDTKIKAKLDTQHTDLSVEYERTGGNVPINENFSEIYVAEDAKTFSLKVTPESGYKWGSTGPTTSVAVTSASGSTINGSGSDDSEPRTYTITKNNGTSDVVFSQNDEIVITIGSLEAIERSISLTADDSATKYGFRSIDSSSSSVSGPSATTEYSSSATINIKAKRGENLYYAFAAPRGKTFSEAKCTIAGSPQTTIDLLNGSTSETIDNFISESQITGNLSFSLKTAIGADVRFNAIVDGPDRGETMIQPNGVSFNYPLTGANGNFIPGVLANQDFKFTITPPSNSYVVKSVAYTYNDGSNTKNGDELTPGNSITIPGKHVKSEVTVTITLKPADKTIAYTLGTSSYNIKSTNSVSSGEYYVSTSSSATGASAIPAKSSSNVAITAGDKLTFYLYNKDGAVNGRTVAYHFDGSSTTYISASSGSNKYEISIPSNNTKDLIIEGVVTDIPVHVYGTSAYNLKGSRNQGSGTYYASTNSSSTSASSRTLIPTSGSTVMATPGSTFSFYLYDNNDALAPNRSVSYRFSSDSGSGANRTLTSNSNGYCTTATIPNDATSITFYEVTAGTVNATYAGYGASDNLATVNWVPASGSSTRLTDTATAVPRGSNFTFTVAPTSSGNGIRVNPSVSVTVGGSSVTPEVISSSINGMTYRIPASRVTGDIVIRKFTSIAAKQSIKFDPVSNLTIAGRDDSLGAMQPYTNGTLTLVAGDDAVVKLTPASGYTLNNLAMTDGDGKAVANVSRNATSGLTTIPAASVKNGMTIKSITTLSQTPAATNVTGFPDDSKISNVHKADVKVLADLGIIKGDNLGNFNPAAPASRADFATMLFRIRGVASAATVSKFPDVVPTIGADYFQAIVASENDNPAVITGFPDGNFYPFVSVTRAQGILMAYRAAGQPAYNGINYFSDLEGWYATAANWGAQNGIVNGIGGGLYNGRGNLTREQLSSILVRAMKAKVFPRMNVTLP